MEHSQGTMEAVAFLGETLGPLFLYDPASDQAAPVYEALAALDCEEAAVEWPFTEPAQVVAALGQMSEALASGEDDDLVWEYRRLFAGPGQKAAPPWGSVYTDRECVVFGEATLALRQWMRDCGIARPGDGSEPEDHIGLMLRLMAWLAQERPELLDAYLSEHLLTWVPHFLGVVSAEARHPFFQGLATLSAASLAGMQEALGLTVEVPRFYR